MSLLDIDHGDFFVGGSIAAAVELDRTHHTAPLDLEREHLVDPKKAIDAQSEYGLEGGISISGGSVAIRAFAEEGER